MRKYRTTSNPSILYGFDKNKKLVPIRKMRAGSIFFGKPASMGKDTTPMVVALNPNRKIIVGFFNAKDVEHVLGAEGNMVAQAKTLTQKMTSPEVLWTAGGGAALGFALASLTGANKVTMTASFAVLGGIIGSSSSSSEKTMSAAGGGKCRCEVPDGTGGTILYGCTDCSNAKCPCNKASNADGRPSRVLPPSSSVNKTGGGKCRCEVPDGAGGVIMIGCTDCSSPKCPCGKAN